MHTRSSPGPLLVSGLSRRPHRDTYGCWSSALDRIRGRLKANYLSFRPPLELDLPGFCMLTGPNGGGKSQLLRMLYEGLRKDCVGRMTGGLAADDGFQYAYGEVVLQEGSWALSNAVSHAGQIKDRALQAVDWLRHRHNRSPQNSEEDHFQHERASYLSERWVPDQGVAGLPESFVYRRRLEIGHVFEDLCHAFYLHMLRTMERSAKSAGSTYESELALSEAPWARLDEFMAEAGLRLRSVPPTPTMMEDYILRLENEYGDLVMPSALSSGEKTIVGLGAWILVTGEHGMLPKLVLLDEADAHLHPALVPGFVEALHRNLHVKHGVKIVMATHRTEAILSCPDGALYEVSKAEPRIRQSPSRRESLMLLTEGRFFAAVQRRCVLVEGEDDAAFYTLATRLCADQGRIGGNCPVFFAATTGAKANAEGAGRPKVQQWVTRLRSSAISDLVLGLVDFDFRGPDEEGVVAIPRHSLENYLLDPLTVYVLLLGRGLAPAVEGLLIRKGQESTLHSLDTSVLDRIAAQILGQVVSCLATPPTDVELEWVPVSYVGGSVVNLPRWFLTRRGHSLMDAFRAAFGPRVASTLNTVNLLDAFERVGVVPLDLADVIEGVRLGVRPSLPSWRT